MEVVDTTQIYSFAPIAAQTDFVQPTEEPIFVLTRSQLKAIIQEATSPILLELQGLRDHQEEDIERLALDIAYDRQRISKLEQSKPQPLQRDRGEILRALLAANGGKMLAKDARQKMHLIKPRFSELLATMKDDIEIRPYHLKKNQKVLVLK
jgi:hypothetical protein